MFVSVAGSGARVLEPEDTKRLAVRVHEAADLARAIATLGRVDADGEHVWLTIESLRSTALAAVEPDRRDRWVESFDAMVAYAVSKGWGSADGRAVRAHIERV